MSDLLPSLLSRHSYTIAQVFLMSATIAGMVHRRTRKDGRPAKQNLIPLYSAKVVVSILILVIQSFEYIALRHDVSSYRPWPECIGDVRLLGTTLSSLYAHELLYRPTMKRHAQAHHVLAVGLIAYLIRRLEEDRLPIYREVGLLWLFQGTTEQVTLIGAIGLRSGWNPRTVSKILHFAAFQTGLIKSITLGAIVYRWGVHLMPLGRQSWTENGNLMWVFALGLIWTQFRSSPISLARRLKRQSVNPSSSTSTSSTIAAPILATLQVALEEVEKSIDAKMGVVGTTSGSDTEVVL